ncbi:type VI secretion system ImpA domain-containing protein [Pseudomonas sp. IB20]|uniref:type VI secretion system protein TssA n=1 Tax=Pseudomonas sp. IB20 TaxID=1702250 RepID=UPI000BA085BF|nr:type VI secretion system protein TssA [Pseudomonas sp. IB20]OZO02901.1 type VI secretion system ImpA domain-containing protein [Pseudomonas sp. IB20]
MVYSDTLYAYYLELARHPCLPRDFAGSDIRFSSEFEVLESELAKAQSIHGASLPDWQKVSELSERLLREHSKDLRVAVWLTWALHQRDSFPGLLAGLGLVRYLCEHHWTIVYPAKLRTRSAAFGWLVLRLEPLFAQNFALADQLPLFQALLEHLASLDELWAEHLGDDAPLLLPIRRQLSERLTLATQSCTEPGGLASVIAQVKQAATQLRKPEQPVNNEKEAHKLLRALQEQARPLCAWWLRQSATDLRALRLSRTLAWLTLIHYPDANGERVTALRAPSPDKLKRFQDRFKQGHYAELLLELEISLASALFWFDGLRMAWECLEALQADLAMTELEMNFAVLLQRLPSLPEFRFDDGTAFADPATCDWIALHVLRHLRKAEPLSAVADVAGEPWEAALQAVMSRLRKDGLKAAVGELKQGLQAACSDRARFHWRLALARLCIRAGKHELGKIQLEQLDFELQRADLERWEPELAFQVAQLLHRCYDLLPQDHAVRERKDVTHRRLCRFDLDAVLE